MMSASVRGRGHPRGARGVAYAAGALVATAIFAWSREVISPGFYYADDTQLGAVGMWYELGARLLTGEIPTLSPQAWQAGNYWAEGQWGLINPLTAGIAVGAHLIDEIALWTALVKIGLLVLMAGGTYLLSRSFGANPGWAAVAAVAVPMAGFTVYMDAASWVTGLITTALFPWVWWALRRVAQGRSPIAFLIFSYLLITSGYVFGTMILAALLVTSMAFHIRRLRTPPGLTLIAASLWSGLWAIVIYLPGVLTAPVTERGNTGVSNDFFLNADLGDFAAISTPTSSGTIGAWWGPATAAPMMYVFWLLPLVVLARPWSRSLWKGTGTAVVVVIVNAFLVVGPSTIGPIRWPVRFMPYVALGVMVLFALLMTRGLPQRMTRASVIAALSTSVTLFALTWALTPSAVKQIGLVTVCQILAILLAAWFLRSLRDAPTASNVVLIRTGVVAVIGLITVPLFAAQMTAFPRSPLPTSAAPRSVSEMRSVLDGVDGDVITVGDAMAGRTDPRSFRERLIANQWYFSTAHVSNFYTVLPFTEFSHDLCMDLRGISCPASLDTLLSIDTATGARVADLLSVSSIVGYRATFPDPPTSLPPGWHVTAEDTYTWRISRDEPLTTAGGVVWSGAGTAVTVESSSDTQVRLRVASVGSDPRIVLSRLPWPGYTLEGAAMSKAVRGYLTTLDLSHTEPGTDVVLTFRPPGYPIMVGSGAAAGVLAVGWTIFSLRRRYRDSWSRLR